MHDPNISEAERRYWRAVINSPWLADVASVATSITLFTVNGTHAWTERDADSDLRAFGAVRFEEDAP